MSELSVTGLTSNPTIFDQIVKQLRRFHDVNSVSCPASNAGTFAFTFVIRAPASSRCAHLEGLPSGSSFSSDRAAIRNLYRTACLPSSASQLLRLLVTINNEPLRRAARAAAFRKLFQLLPACDPFTADGPPSIGLESLMMTTLHAQLCR
jgi:hypothetical protein